MMEITPELYKCKWEFIPFYNFHLGNLTYILVAITASQFYNLK